MTGSILFSFTDKIKFKDIDFSFSRELDSLKNKKLYRILIVTDPRFIGHPNNLYMDRSEAFYELDKLEVKYSKEIYKYFEAEIRMMRNSP